MLSYFPAVGPPGPLAGFNDNPNSTTSGVFGGYVVALRLNVDFADAGLIAGATSARFGDLRLSGFTTLPLLNGMSAREFLTNVNTLLGNAPAVYDIGSLADVVDNLSYAFQDGIPNRFAHEHLVPGPVQPRWSNGEIVTFTQGDWGDAPDGTNVATTLAARFGSVYFPSFGVLEVGLTGASGYSIALTGAPNVGAFLPAFGAAAALNTDLSNPTSSSSGVFGGDLVALRLNVDFTDAHWIGGTSSLAFGDLTLCGFSQAALNGMSIRTFLVTANTWLGGGSAAIPFADVASVASQLNATFFEGVPSAFAQAHLFSGSCP